MNESIINPINKLAQQPVQIKIPTRNFLKSQYSSMLVISVLATLGILGGTLIFEIDALYKFFLIFIPVIFTAMGILTYFGKDNWARLTGTILLPLWINIAILVRGPGFSESSTMMAFLIFTYILYNENHKVRNRIILFTLISHILVLLYLNYNPPIVEVKIYPLDDVIVFLLSTSWIIIFLKKLEHSKNKLIRKLEVQNDLLTLTTEELEKFTYIASHDLKSPLRTIISFADLTDMHLRKKDYKAVKEDLSFIRDGAKQMNYLISDILEYSKINGSTKNQKKEVNLTEALNTAERNLRVEIKENNARIIKETLPTIIANETEFILLFQNIIQNGIKYNTNDVPIIKIWPIQIENHLNIYFKDNGIGIDAAFHDQIFGFFKRLHTNDQYQGTGLGLGLCKKIIKKYGGDISIESSQGNGSTFCISIPNNEIDSNTYHRSDTLAAV